MHQLTKHHLLWILAVTVAISTIAEPSIAATKKPHTAEVAGFSIKYDTVVTPKKGWGSDQESEWLLSFGGGLKSKKALSYRGRTLAAGQHDVWIEKGKGEWYYIFIGNRKDPESDRLRGMFKLYEQEEGVDQIEFQLKLTRKATKLKFTINSGRSQGHGNFKILESPVAKPEDK